MEVWTGIATALNQLRQFADRIVTSARRKRSERRIRSSLIPDRLEGARRFSSIHHFAHVVLFAISTVRTRRTVHCRSAEESSRQPKSPRSFPVPFHQRRSVPSRVRSQSLLVFPLLPPISRSAGTTPIRADAKQQKFGRKSGRPHRRSTVLLHRTHRSSFPQHPRRSDSQPRENDHHRIFLLARFLQIRPLHRFRRQRDAYEGSHDQCGRAGRGAEVDCDVRIGRSIEHESSTEHSTAQARSDFQRTTAAATRRSNHSLPRTRSRLARSAHASRLETVVSNVVVSDVDEKLRREKDAGELER